MADAARELFESFVDGGPQRVQEAIENEEAEGLFLDFKQNRDKQGPLPRLTDGNRQNLGKALSAFANTSGGVLVWGVEAKDRKAYRPEPIPELARFVRELQTATITSVNPPVLGVVHRPIPLENGTGFAVSYIPESGHKPHQCVVDPARNYWMRNADSMAIAEHPFVRALFAERARPELGVEVLRAEVVEPIDVNPPPLVNVRLGLVNRGEVAAKNVALLIACEPSALIHAVVRMVDPFGAEASGYDGEALGAARLFVLGDGQVLYPRLPLHVVTVHLGRASVLKHGSLEIKGHAFCDGPSIRFEVRLDQDELSGPPTRRVLPNAPYA